MEFCEMKKDKQKSVATKWVGAQQEFTGNELALYRVAVGNRVPVGFFPMERLVPDVMREILTQPQSSPLLQHVAKIAAEAGAVITTVNEMTAAGSTLTIRHFEGGPEKEVTVTTNLLPFKHALAEIGADTQGIDFKPMRTEKTDTNVVQNLGSSLTPAAVYA